MKRLLLICIVIVGIAFVAGCIGGEKPTGITTSPDKDNFVTPISTGGKGETAVLTTEYRNKDDPSYTREVGKTIAVKTAIGDRFEYSIETLIKIEDIEKVSIKLEDFNLQFAKDNNADSYTDRVDGINLKLKIQSQKPFYIKITQVKTFSTLPLLEIRANDPQTQANWDKGLIKYSEIFPEIYNTTPLEKRQIGVNGWKNAEYLIITARIVV